MTGSDYDPFAWLYNKHWGGQFVEAALPTLTSHVLQDLSDGSRVLDLACGTGQLAAMLTERGYAVTGVDSSEAMLGYARVNAPDAEFVLSEAVSFELPHRYAAAISTYDSLNHLLKLEELQQAFGRVYAALQKGGRFMFDLNMEAGYQARWGGTSSFVEKDHVAVTRSAFDESEQLGMVDITLFRMRDGTWNRTDINLRQRCYTEEQVTSALDRIGFRKIRVLEAAADLELANQIGRSFFIGTKTEE